MDRTGTARTPTAPSPPSARLPRRRVRFHPVPPRRVAEGLELLQELGVDGARLDRVAAAQLLPARGLLADPRLDEATQRRDAIGVARRHVLELEGIDLEVVELVAQRPVAFLHTEV